MKKYFPTIISVFVLIVTVLIGLITNLITNNPPDWLRFLSSPYVLVGLVLLASLLIVIQVRYQNTFPQIKNDNKFQIDLPKIDIPARHYQVGRVSANVFMDLLGGGDQSFDCGNLNFEYEHIFDPLPEPIEAKRGLKIIQLEMEAKEAGQVFFNGPAIRLHSFDLGIHQSINGKEEKKPTLYFRPTSWYDYALANRNLGDKIQIPGRNLTTTIKDEYADESRLVSTRTIDWIQLTNILTITIIVVSKDNYVLLGRRTDRVDNSKGVFVASAAENMHRWKDEPSNPNDPWSLPNGVVNVGSNVGWDYQPKACPNPFFTVLRGLREEVAEDVADAVTLSEIRFISLAWNLLHFQPHLIAYVPIQMVMSDIEKNLSSSRGEDSWETSLFSIPFEPVGELKDLLFKYEFADVSKAAILKALVYKYGFREVNQSLNTDT